MTLKTLRGSKGVIKGIKWIIIIIKWIIKWIIKGITRRGLFIRELPNHGERLSKMLQP